MGEGGRESVDDERGKQPDRPTNQPLVFRSRAVNVCTYVRVSVQCGRVYVCAHTHPLNLLQLNSIGIRANANTGRAGAFIVLR